MELLQSQALQYVYDIAAHLESQETATRLEHYGITAQAIQGTASEVFVILLADVATWREIVKTPRKYTIPQTVIGAYTHAALPLTTSTRFTWRPNEALGIAANKFAYSPGFSPEDSADYSVMHNPSAVARIFRRHFNAQQFDSAMDKKRREAPYVFVEPMTYRTLARHPNSQPRWHSELQNLCYNFFWHPEVRGARAELLVLPEAEFSQGLLRPRDIIHSLRVTGRGWSLLRQADVMAEYTRVQSVLNTL